MLSVFACAVIFFPAIIKQGKKLLPKGKIDCSKTNEKENFPLFIFSCVGLAVLIGLALPLSVVSSDPTAFSFLGKTESPFSYIKTSLLVFTGFFLVWPFLLYKMFPLKTKILMSKAMFVIFLIALLNSFAYKFDYGTINILFNIDEEIVQKSYPVLNALSLASFFVFVILAFGNFKKIKKFYVPCVAILTFSLLVLSGKDFSITKREFNSYKENVAKQSKDNLDADIEKVFHLSKTRKNVVVIFLDKACSAFIPVLQNEKPEILQKFDGFTYFPNTASFGSATLYGAPAMLGGYDYTPENMNKRDDVLLQQKHNEATLLMPLNFLEHGFNVTVTDPPLPNFTDIGDLSAFEKYPEISAKILKGKLTRRYKQEKSEDTEFDELCRKGMLNFSVLQTLLPGLRNSFYRIVKNDDSDADDFFDSFPSLYYFRNLTDFDSDKGNFIFIGNETPHFGTFLNTESYDEVSFEKDESSKILDNSDKDLMMSYDVFISTLKQVGLWLDFLKENDCYDNTRIIVVSDHGHNFNIKVPFNDESKFSDSEILSFNPLLLIKDFYSSSGFETDNTFMTNADTVFLATDNLIKNPENPFLKSGLKQEKGNGIDVYYTFKGEHNPMPIRKNKTLTLRNGFKIKNDFFDVSSWERIEK